MRTKSGDRNKILAGILALFHLIQWVFPPLMSANPTGATVVGGHATVSGVGTAHVTVSQASQQAILNWQSFNIAPHEVTQFVQPNASAIALNRIFDQNPSQIMGALRANGTVMLVNPNGVFFGPNAQVNVGGLIASSLNITNANFLAGHYLFEGAGVEGAVKNLGLIRSLHDGVYLLAPNVENSGVINAPGGNIVLAAGAKAYLASRPDGRGFLTELSAPTGQATNLKDLIADGGHITLAGRVVNQGGMVQANSVREKSGKIELFASEALTLKSGSQTLAKGDTTGVSPGGTVLAIADKTKGTALFEKGATIDVSGGTNGGRAGFTELSGSRVKLGGLFTGSAYHGYQGGRLLIDPTTPVDLSTLAATDFADINFSTPRDSSGNLVAGEDLLVTGFFDLNNVKPPATGGTIRFDAGQDLIFQNTFLQNNPAGTPAKWDIVGVAERNILFTGNGSILQTAYGGSINLQAKTGSVDLSDPNTGILSTIHIDGSGSLSIKTATDLKAATGIDATSGLLQGISINGPGRLNLDVGGDFIGGFVNGVARGPGFVLSNSDPTARPQHTVTVGGKIGETNLPLGPDGLPLTATQQRAKDPTAPLVKESTAKYADFALSGGELTVTAGGNIYVRHVQDAGLVGGLDAQAQPRDPTFSAGLENNKVTFVSHNGNIILNTSRADGPQEPIPELAGLRGWLPASFEARAEKGSIQVRSDLNFLPSPTGSVTFFAKNDIQGVPKTNRQNNPDFEWLYVGFPGIPGGHWQAVDRTTIPQHPELLPYWANRNSLPASIRNTKPGDDQFPDFAKIDADRSPPLVRLLEIDPNNLVGNIDYHQMTNWGNASRLDRSVPLAPDNKTTLAPVSFTAEQGNISKLTLDLVSRPFRKEVTIEAGNKIDFILTKIFLPDLGTKTQTITEHIPLFVDLVTNQARPIKPGDVVLIRAVNPQTGQVVVRPWDGKESVAANDLVNVVFRDVQVPVTTPNVAATIKAKDILLNRTEFQDGGIELTGGGTARIIATHNLDLGTGRGISAAPSVDRPSERGGVVDVAIGNSLDMVISSILTSNGAGVSIHGYDAARPYVVGYDNSALYPVQFPDSARAGLNLPAAGGKMNIGENSSRSSGTEGRPTGIQVTTGGSVGQMAKQPVVNQDGTVTVNVVKDPAAILIRTHGDVDVNKSRIATFNGGDIRITSTNGNINAGSGNKNELTQTDVPNGKFKDDGTGNLVEQTEPFQVPGSGIFTFHPADFPKGPDGKSKPLVFPTFNDPEINALLAEAARERTFGRNVSALEARANQLRTERQKTFEENVLNPYIDKLKIGDVTLTAETGVRAVERHSIPADGSGRIIIPEAGIQGRNVTLNGVLDFRGGTITGRVVLPPNAAVVGQPSFVGGAPPPGVAPPPPPLSGGGTAAAASSTAASTGASVKNADTTQEAASESSSKQAGNRVASSTESKDDKKSQFAKAIRVKRGVVIQVDVKPQIPSAN